MKKDISRIIYTIVAGAISIIIVDLGYLMIKEFEEKPIIGLLIIMLGILLLWFSFNTPQIKINQDEINDIKEELNKIKTNEEAKEKLLNTIKDIVLLNTLKLKMNKRGRITSNDILEIIKIIVIIIVGYIIIKALLSAT